MKITPQALRDMLARNPQLSIENQAACKVQGAKPERNQAPALVRSKTRSEIGVPGVTVRFTGYRVRPCDPENFSAGCKDLLDGLRHAKLIPDDSPWDIILQTTQVKVRTYREEFTDIEVISCNP